MEYRLQDTLLLWTRGRVRVEGRVEGRVEDGVEWSKVDCGVE